MAAETLERVTLSEAAGLPLPAGELRLSAGASGPRVGTLGDREVELLRVAPGHESAARRLVALGAAGVGGVVAGGVTADGELVVVRRRPSHTASDLAAGERLPPARALALTRQFALALATLEEASLSAGTLRPVDCVLDDDGWLVADGLVRALLGQAATTTTGTQPSPRWTPPEQADGASWNAAANRYVLGLIAYRLLAGEHPFSGAGLRHAHATREPPPFEESVLGTLRPGVQAFVLSLLHPNAEQRPASARLVLKTVETLLERGVTAREGAAPEGRAVTPARAQPSEQPSRPAEPAPPARRQRAAWSRSAATLVLFASAVVVLAVWWFAPRGDAQAARSLVATRSPIAGRSAQTCAPCHAREVAEWRRSVMGFAAKSPLYLALESAVEEQVGQDARCPGGAGILRKQGAGACFDPASSVAVTGSGGEHWCVHCHAPLDQLASTVPPWNGADVAARGGRKPLGELFSPEAAEGITCVACHTSVGPVEAHAQRRRGDQRGGQTGDRYEGNPTWTSTQTGVTFPARPEDALGLAGISNSGYRLEPRSLFIDTVTATGPMVHAAQERGARAYLRSSEFCGACHDVRLFGTDVVGVRERGEHFKRLRNAYSEWSAWSKAEERAGKRAASCQDCHMSMFPGVCQAGAPRSDEKSESCPPGTGFVARAPGAFGRSASHYFTGVEVPMADSFPANDADDRSLDSDGVPIGLRARRDLLLRNTFTLKFGSARASGGRLDLPLEITNVGAGHRVPAGFSQEREFWIELRVLDARGQTVYEVGRVDRPDEDLADKRFLRVTTTEGARDGRGRPLGMFGADVADGPDVGRWSPDPSRGGTEFRGQGLINFQNGFLRCVRCIGSVASDGSCTPLPGQEGTRAARLEDGDYDADTGLCRSNMFGGHELFETYFPVGSLDADRGVLRAPDAIIDTRSAPPGVPLRYTYALNNVGQRPLPLRAEARLRFRAFPPFLLRAFVAYERGRAARGDRRAGPQMDEGMVKKLEIIDIANASIEIR